MKVVILTLFSLILLAQAEEKAADPELDVELLPATSLYDTIFADYYNHPKEQPSNKKSPKNKSSNKNQGPQNGGENKHKHQNNYDGYENKHKHQNNYENKPKYDYNDYEKYLQYREEYKQEYNRLVGRKGLGYDKRTATSYGLRAPITPELLEVVGQKYQKNENYNTNKYNDEKLFTIFV